MRSAAYRIAFVYSAAFALAMAAIGAITFWAMHVAFTRQLDDSLREESATLVGEYRKDGEAELASAIAQRQAIGTRDTLLYAVFGPDGARIHGNMRSAKPPLGLNVVPFAGSRGGSGVARGLGADLGDGKRLLVAYDRERIARIDQTIISVFAAGSLLILLMGVTGALFLGGYLRRRLGAISEAAEAIVAGNIKGRMPLSANGDEFDRLAGSLNAMLERIEMLVENVRQVSSDIAHDLRTPLARLRNRLEQGLHGTGTTEPRQVIEDGLHRIDEVLDLFAAILRIAEVESGHIRQSFAPVDLSGLAEDIAESYAPSIAESGRTLTWTTEPHVSLDGDRELLAQALINLIENAQRHTPEGTSIRLDLSADDARVRLSVSDDGPGVSAAERARIGRRFVRLEASRTSPGHGLGLNLVTAIAALHGSVLSFEDNGPGFRAILEFPRP